MSISLTIYESLCNKVSELRESGLPEDKIREEGMDFLRDSLRRAKFLDRKQFFLMMDRDKKLNELLK